MDAKPGGMGDRTEAAIQAILIGLLNMQQLNMSLADRLAAGSWLEEEEPREERYPYQERSPSRLSGIHQRPTDLREGPTPLGRLRRPVPGGGSRLRSHQGAGQEGVV